MDDFDVVAIDKDTGKPLDPQPSFNERDREGHWRGCASHGCAMTRCIETKHASAHVWSQKTWKWDRRSA